MTTAPVEPDPNPEARPEDDPDIVPSGDPDGAPVTPQEPGVTNPEAT